MTLSGPGFSQSLLIPRVVAPVGSLTRLSQSVSYVYKDPTHVQFVSEKVSASLQLTYNEKYLTAVSFNIDGFNGETALLRGALTTVPSTVSTMSFTSFNCIWSMSELAVAALGLGITVSALIAATGGIGALAVVALVAAHLGTLASLVDVANNCS